MSPEQKAGGQMGKPLTGRENFPGMELLGITRGLAPEPRPAPAVPLKERAEAGGPGEAQ